MSVAYTKGTVVDLNRTPERDVPMWSETRWAGCFDPDAGSGLFLHAGRLRGDLDWWWAQVAVYLPDGQVAVERSWVHQTVDDGVRTPSLDLRVHERGWSASFDGIAELTTTQALGRAPRGSGAPSVPVRFDVVADDSRPWWDMFSGARRGEDFGDMHVEQMGRSEGALSVGDATYRLDGVSYYDHSCGVRDWTHFHSHQFALIAMPEYTLHAGQVYASPTEARPGGGVWFDQNGGARRIRRTSMPRLEDVLGSPGRFNWTMEVDGHGELTFQVEVIHTVPATITFDNDNINGCAWDAEGDPLFLTECQVAVTAPDGSVGYGHIERSNRRSCLRRP